MTDEDILAIIRDACHEVVPSLRTEHLSLDSYVVRDLGIDSMYLVSILVALEDRLGRSIQLFDWLARAKREGTDVRLRSIVDHIRARS